MKKYKVTRERQIFLWGVLALVVIDLFVVTPLASMTNQAPLIFCGEILVAVLWTVWYERVRKRAANK